MDDGEEVTRVTDRQLVLRAVNSTLRTETAIGALTREVSRVREEVESLKPGFRRGDPRASIPEVAQALVDAVEEITDHGQQRRPATNSDPVRGVVKRVLDDAELEVARSRRKRVVDVVMQGFGVLAGAGLLELARMAFSGHW